MFMSHVISIFTCPLSPLWNETPFVMLKQHSQSLQSGRYAYIWRSCRLLFYPWSWIELISYVKLLKLWWCTGAGSANNTTAGTCPDQVFNNNALLWTKLEPELWLVCWCRWSTCRAAACWLQHCQCLPWRHQTWQWVIFYLAVFLIFFVSRCPNC